MSVNTRSEPRRRLTALLTVAFAAAALSSSGCRPPSAGTPVDAFLSFQKAAQKGEAKAAWALLSEASRQKLTERTEAVKSASKGAVTPDPASVFFAQTSRSAAVTEVKVEKEEGDRAQLQVASGGEVTSVSMVKESGGWRVDVTSALEKL